MAAGSGHSCRFVRHEEEVISSCGKLNFFFKVDEICQGVYRVVQYFSGTLHTGNEAYGVDAVLEVGIILID